MSAVLSPTEVLNVSESEDMSLRLLDERFRSLAAAYPDLHLEQTAEGEFVVMPPPYTETGRQNFRLDQQLGLWMAQGGGGEAFDSSSVFRLPNGAKRSPDLSWVESSRWAALAPEQKREFSQICPDFVVELRSETDRLPPLQRKMCEYITNGARLGWLIDPRLRRVEVYRPGNDSVVSVNPATISGEDVLPGFVLDLAPVWG